MRLQHSTIALEMSYPRGCMSEIAEQIADEAFELVKDQLRFTRSPEMRFALLLKTLSWDDVEAQVIAACRRKAGL